MRAYRYNHRDDNYYHHERHHRPENHVRCTRWELIRGRYRGGISWKFIVHGKGGQWRGWGGDFCTSTAVFTYDKPAHAGRGQWRTALRAEQRARSRGSGWTSSCGHSRNGRDEGAIKHSGRRTSVRSIQEGRKGSSPSVAPTLKGGAEVRW